MFLSIMREATLLELMGWGSRVGTIIASHKANMGTMWTHFQLPPDVKILPLCQFWCEHGRVYAEHENEKHLWEWLQPHCSCSGGGTKHKYDLNAIDFVLVGTGSLIDAWEEVLKEAGAKHITSLSCHDLASSSNRTESSSTMYLFESCLPEGHEYLDLKPHVQHFATSVRAVFSYFDHVLDLGKRLRSRDKTARLLWLVPEHFKSSVYGIKTDVPTRSRGYEIALLRQYLLQRHVLFLHNIHSVDTERLLQEKRDQGLRVGTTNAHLEAYLDRLLSTGSLLHTFPEPTMKEDYRLSEKCTIIMHSRAYDDLCMPRPHKLLPVLVTGLGGSATHAISDALSVSGVDMPHESLGSHGSVCWMYAVNDVLAGTQYPHHSQLSPHESHLLSPRFRHIVHVVRPAMDQISTFTVHHKETYAFVFRAVMELLETGHHHAMEGGGSDAAVTTLKGVTDINGNEAASSAIIKTKEQAQLRLRIAYRKASQEGGCERGNACNLYFAATSWLYWNRHVSSVLRHSTLSSSSLNTDKTRQFIIGSDKEEGKGGIERVVSHVCSLLREESSEACDNLDASLTATTEAFHRTHGEFSLQDVKAEEGALAKELAALEYMYGL